MNVEDDDLVPSDLPEPRQDEWRTALRILDEIVHETGFEKATIAAYGGMDFWDLQIAYRAGDLTVHGPTPGGGGSVTEAWFTCLLEVEIKTIGLQRLSEWMEGWHGYDQVFFPALLVEGRTCRSHRVGDTETFSFVWE